MNNKNIEEFGQGNYREEDKDFIIESVKTLSRAFRNEMNNLRTKNKPSPQDLFDLGRSLLMSITVSCMDMMQDAYNSPADVRKADMDQYINELSKHCVKIYRRGIN